MREAVETMPSDWSKHAGESRDKRMLHSLSHVNIYSFMKLVRKTL